MTNIFLIYDFERKHTNVDYIYRKLDKLLHRKSSLLYAFILNMMTNCDTLQLYYNNYMNKIFPNIGEKFLVVITHVSNFMVIKWILKNLPSLVEILEMNDIPRLIEHSYKQSLLSSLDNKKYAIYFCENYKSDLFIKKRNDIDPLQKEKFIEELYKRRSEFTDIEFDTLVNLLNSFKMIKFEEFLESLSKSLLTYIRSSTKLYIVAIVVDDSIKSNLWVTLLLIHILYNTSIIDEKLARPDNILFVKKINIPIIKLMYPNHDVLIADDCGYSGSQMSNLLKYMNNNIKNEIHVIYANITNNALNLLTSISPNIKIYYDYKFHSYNDFFGENIDSCSYLINLMNVKCNVHTIEVYEHKLADHLSTYTTLMLGSLSNNGDPILKLEPNKTIFKDCYSPTPDKDYDEEIEGSCMYPFYKTSLKSLWSDLDLLM